MEGAVGMLTWLDATQLARAMRGNTWLYPVVEIVHIVGIVLLVGPVAMFDPDGEFLALYERVEDADRVLARAVAVFV